jgi:plasmid stabilization system protein ParE
MKLEWSAAALADLDRFATFLRDQHPRLAVIVAAEIRDKVSLLSEHPLRLVMLRVFHGREQR